MDSNGKKEQEENIARFLKSPAIRLLDSTQQLMGIVLAPEIVDEEQKKRIILSAQSAVRAMRAEIN